MELNGEAGGGPKRRYPGRAPVPLSLNPGPEVLAAADKPETLQAFRSGPRDRPQNSAAETITGCISSHKKRSMIAPATVAMSFELASFLTF